MRSHRCTVEQMILLEPVLSETVLATCLTVIRQATDEAVRRGVPAEAARDFVLGHLRVELAIVFQEKKGAVFSDGALKAIDAAMPALFRPDWKKVFEPEAVLRKCSPDYQDRVNRPKSDEENFTLTVIPAKRKREPESSLSFAATPAFLQRRIPARLIIAVFRANDGAISLHQELKSPPVRRRCTSRITVSRALRHVHFIQLFNLEESGVTCIGSSSGLARSRFTNIVNDDVVVCDLPFGVRIDSVDNLPHAKGLHFHFTSSRSSLITASSRVSPRRTAPPGIDHLPLRRWFSPAG